ncbi:VanZ family protein [Cohnella lubricantis]|uniref:VanZ family protein n=1 Tax=Cohnella lubricantis TaxID=2163172 RepID=UPI00289361B9|nr:VanZ family protein [Cohnella lubricantis]MBP2120490.1 glycopeptide antibiotics resistance protein [Cohnella lubricantis]
MLLIVIYLSLLIYWMFFGFSRAAQSEYMYNLIPFSTISHFIQHYHYRTSVWIINLIGNVVVFVPFGILLPIIAQRKLGKHFILFLCGLFILESIQFLSKRGNFDIDDFILNSLGFYLGYGIYKAMVKSSSIRRKG